MTEDAKIRFGIFELDPGAGELWKRGRKLKLSPQPLRVLALLAAAPGQLISRAAIKDQLWGQDTFVDSEHGLNFCIREIRSALGDSAKKPRFVETLPRRGYRFVAETSSGSAQGLAPVQPPSSNQASADVQLAAYEYYARARKSFVQVGKVALDEAGRDFERAVALDSNYAMAHSGLGATYALRNIFRRNPEDLDRALSHLQRAIALDPELAEPYPWLCYVYGRTNQLTKALEAGHRGVELQPEFVHAHYFLGLAYFGYSEIDSSHYQNAAHHLLNATKVGPGWKPSWFVLSSLSLLNGDYEHAELFARKLLDSSLPGLPFIGAEIVLASVALHRGQLQIGREVIAGFLEILNTSDHMYGDTMSAVAGCVLGDIEMRDGAIAQALSAYRRAWHVVQEHPRMMSHQRIRARVLGGLASAYAAKAEPERAAGLLQTAVELAEHSLLPQHNGAAASLPELFCSLAAACVRNNNPMKALEMLTKAVDTGWRDARWFACDPELASLKDEPRFLTLLDTVRRSATLDFSREQFTGP